MAGDSGLSAEQYAKQNPVQQGSSGTTTTNARTGVSEGYLPPPRLRARVSTLTSGIKYDRQVAIPERQVAVSGLVTPDNEVVPFYDLATKPRELLAQMNDVSRKKFIDNLYTRGWYAGKKTEGGLGDNDVEAAYNLLYYSNLQGQTWDTVFNTVARAPISSATSGRVVQVTSTGDLMEIANKTALQTIGRKLNDAEAQRFATAYQGVQRGAPDTMAAPSADVYFQQRLEQKYGAETDATKYLNAISNVAKVLGGM